MLDYLGIELDFMYLLCQRELEQQAAGEDADATRALEARFLGEHLGGWLGGFCKQARAVAKTDLYKGFLILLDLFICAEVERFPI